MLLMLLCSDCNSIRFISAATHIDTFEIVAVKIVCCFHFLLFKKKKLLSTVSASFANYLIDYYCVVLVIVGLVVQENNKTKHPQLLYEAKLYNILQGGSMLFFFLIGLRNWT